jgi:methionyl-tRNA formyltransferase
MNSSPSIVFFGTPEFAVTILEEVQKHYSVRAVVTVPDKPTGRGLKLSTSPVKDFAVSKGIPVLQPQNLKDETFLKELLKINADLFVVVAFRMLPDVVWKMPIKGTFNLHASLLPQYRGAAPINWAIINGEKETGVTTFFLEHAIDTGKVIFRESTMIGRNETAGELHDRLMGSGAQLVLKTIGAIAKGEVHLMDQTGMSHGRPLKMAPKLNKENTKINPRMRVEEAANFIHGLSPYPAAHTQLSNEHGVSFSLKIYSVTPVIENHNNPPGTVVTDHKSFLHIYFSGGYVSVNELQLSGRNRVKIRDFLNGTKMEGKWFIE